MTTWPRSTQCNDASVCSYVWMIAFLWAIAILLDAYSRTKFVSELGETLNFCVVSPISCLSRFPNWSMFTMLIHPTHIHPNARSAHATRHIYITNRTPGKANYLNVLKSVENDLCFNFNLNSNLLFNLILFSDWRFTFYIMHTYWIVLILNVFVSVILHQSLKPATYKETLGWHVHGISNFDIANGGAQIQNSFVLAWAVATWNLKKMKTLLDSLLQNEF